MKMRFLTILIAFGACGLLAPVAGHAEGQKDYRFVNIADTNGAFSDFSPNSFTIDVGGTVGFSAPLKGGGRGIFKATGGSTIQIAKTGDTLESGRSVQQISDTAFISNTGDVGFHAVFDEFNQGVYKGHGGMPAREAVNYYYDLTSPGINSQGKLAWTGFFGLQFDPQGFDSSRHYVLRSPAQGESGTQGTAGAIIAHTGGDNNITGFFGDFGLASISDSGTVAFRALIRSGGEGIFIGQEALPDRHGPGDAKTTLVADTVSPGSPFSGFGNIQTTRPDINTADIVVFGATLKNGVQGIFRWSRGGTLYTIVDNRGLFSQVSLTPAINSSGIVAFTATVKKTGRAGVFVGPDPLEDSVIQTGNALFGSVVVGVAGGPRTLSDSGKVAFYYQLADGRRGIAVAIPNGNKKPTGDLVIKESTEPASAFSAPGIYVAYPTGNQLREVSFEPRPGSAVSFDVEIRNNSTKDERYVLFGGDSGTGPGGASWKVEALAGTIDNWPGIRTGGGVLLPVLQPGAKIALKMRMSGADPNTALPRGSNHEFFLSVQSYDDPGFVHDAVGARAEAVQINVTMHRPTFGGVTEASLADGIDAPLEFKPERDRLGVQPRVTSGLVADGVTPLLLKLKADALQELEYDVALEIESGGSLRSSFPVNERLRVLKDGKWTSDLHLSFASGQQEHYLCVDPILADDLQLAAGQTELKLRLRLRHAGSGEEAESKTILVRRPYITLIHGYNTNGDWGDAFVQTLKRSRSAEFVKVIRYGQGPPGASDTAKFNTILPFGQLAIILENHLNEVRREISQGWAFTRHDAICHSQGGVLARMLTNKNVNQWVSEPFRSDSNFHRGRFHRLVTIGSPHNGTRLVRYITELKKLFSVINFCVPSAVSKWLIGNGTVQKKFDPIGADITLINRREPTAPWFPDPEAKLHLVQTSAPAPDSLSLAELALGLAITRGAVIPKGSDGVVDVESMGATPTNGFSRSNVFYINPAEHAVSHAYVDIIPEFLADRGVPPFDIFGGEAGQVSSLDAADHIIGALDQTNGAIFGPFVIPPPLPQSDVNAIKGAAEQVQFGRIVIDDGATSSGRTSRKVFSDAISSVSTFKFQVDPEALDRPVIWTGDRYGAGGVQPAGGFNFAAVPGYPDRVTVTVDNSVPGDVILYGTAYLKDGTAQIGPGVLVSSAEPNPAHYTISSIEVPPTTGRYPFGITIQPELWVNYQCISQACPGNLRVRRWIDRSEFHVSSSAPGVVDVSDPLSWNFLSLGTSSVSLEWRGHTATASFDVYDPNAAPAGQLLNISTRMHVGTDPNQLIGGFIVTGSEPKTVIVLATGPSLEAFGLSGFLADPVLELYQGNTLIASNDNWKIPAQAEIEATGFQPGDEMESALVRTLAPGDYTAIVRGTNGGTGVGTVQLYDLSHTSNSKLANISSRGFVQVADDRVMIAGFIVGGDVGASSGIMVRAIAPSLSALIPGVLPDPTLELKDANGSTLLFNDDWQQSPQADAISARGLAPSDTREAALAVSLSNGAYTAIVRGKDGATGVAVVEVYNVD